MYYRRKILLALLQVFGNTLNKIDLQKLLFLTCRFQESPSFNFVPYKYGCFSFQANADLNTMVKYKQVVEHKNKWVRLDETDYFLLIKENDKKAIRNIKNIFEHKTTNELIKYTYKNYPYFAIKSTIAKNILNRDELKNVDKVIPNKTNKTLFTIGYEGLSIEQYLNKLIVNDVKVLCDVRKNPLSMKYGFSKNQLKNACDGVGIIYVHFPELGIKSDKRKDLETQSDYDTLFSEYKSEILTETIKTQKEVLNVLEKNDRVALTCFEANINQCHRKHLGEAIHNLSKSKYELKHI